MSRCRSWRSRLDTRHTALHPPGTCRACWRPCFRPVEADQLICEDCLFELAEHRDPNVRLALLNEDPPEEVVQLLATDLDPAVQRAAAFRLLDASTRSFSW